MIKDFTKKFRNLDLNINDIVGRESESLDSKSDVSHREQKAKKRRRISIRHI